MVMQRLLTKIVCCQKCKVLVWSVYLFWIILPHQMLLGHFHVHVRDCQCISLWNGTFLGATMFYHDIKEHHAAFIVGWTMMVQSVCTHSEWNWHYCGFIIDFLIYSYLVACLYQMSVCETNKNTIFSFKINVQATFSDRRNTVKIWFGFCIKMFM